jgi:hypothetical protein
MTECNLCGEEITQGSVPLADPWGEIYGYAHAACYDNYEPSDRDLERSVESYWDRVEREIVELKDAGRV